MPGEDCGRLEDPLVDRIANEVSPKGCAVLMKLKRLPEDFRVEELPNVSPGSQGRFVLYRLTKRGLGTPEAIEAIRRRWNLSAEQVRHGGLKDRHALTTQYLTILNGPERPLRQENLELEPIGKLPHPYGPAHFRGNRFELVLRDLNGKAAHRAQRALQALPLDGLPNYFDDQRFGSVGFDGGFIARAWLVGDHEQALRLAIAEPNPHDRPDTRDEKAILREHWGTWPEAKARLDRSHARSLVTYLVDHPTDFRGAFARVRRDLRSLYFSAFQSYLWNLILARWIEHNTRQDQRILIDFRVAPLPLHLGLDPDQAEILNGSRLPLPASRTPLPTGEIGELARSVVNEQGLVWEEIRVRHLKDVFFSKGNRLALFFPENLTHDLLDDDLYPGRQKLLLGFELPKGAYATLLVKRITDAS
ncbi:tRNA pseudouridine(13) synthase TruD [soil metagenome]